MSKSLLNNVPEKSIHKVAEYEYEAPPIPVDVSNDSKSDTISKTESASPYAFVHDEMNTIEEPHRSMFFWLLDLMVRDS